MAKGKSSRRDSLLERLVKHFGADPAGFSVVEQNFGFHERANLHLALEEMLLKAGRESELVGIVRMDEYHAPRLAKLSRARSSKRFETGPVEFADVPLVGEQHLACVKTGLYLIREADHLLAVLIAEDTYGPKQGIVVEVMANDQDEGLRFLRELTRGTRYGKAFRGKVLSLECDPYRGTKVVFHRIPEIERKDIILPEEILQRVERHTLTFSRHAERLRAAGRHLKRGILLYGPAGTGKTLTAMYLVSQMKGRTVLLLTGAGMGAIETACQLGRALAPATLILEDVDLIGTQRNRQTVDANALLFELLNQMDGLADDTDILFILTTNRPDILEPALAARPGRIDQAIEIPPPDAECRRKLFDLYAKGLPIKIRRWDRLIERTEGTTGAFIRELLRKAAVFAADEGGRRALAVGDKHMDEALAELLVAGGPLTQSLLGGKAASAS